MRIIVDNREQAPFQFQGKHYQDVEVSPGTLQSGDYSLAGLEDKIAVERKSLGDLVMCLGRERGRFEAELTRAQWLDTFCVAVEASWRIWLRASIGAGSIHIPLASPWRRSWRGIIVLSSLPDLARRRNMQPGQSCGNILRTPAKSPAPLSKRTGRYEFSHQQ